MKTIITEVDGIICRALVVTDKDETTLCENCCLPYYSHESLAREDETWCLNCNDKIHRGHMTEQEMAVWSMEQMNNGKAIIVVKEEEA